jgi:hypothetical protein
MTIWHRHVVDGRPTPEMLHVWIVRNGNGQFAQGLDASA